MLTSMFYARQRRARWQQYPGAYRWTARALFEICRTLRVHPDAALPMQWPYGMQVVLRSGSPPMTVRRAVTTRIALDTGMEWGVHCDWCDHEGRHQRAAFGPSQLREYGKPLTAASVRGGTN